MEYENGYQQLISESKYECLLFDVDDTLYPFSSGLSTQCTKNIREYMVNHLDIEESKVPEVCAQLYRDYGTTMAGLRAFGYNFDYDEYHSIVHGRLPYEYLKPDPVLRNLLHSLPIRKVIFSNANEAHVAEVLQRLRLVYNHTYIHHVCRPLSESNLCQIRLAERCYPLDVASFYRRMKNMESYGVKAKSLASH